MSGRVESCASVSRLSATQDAPPKSMRGEYLPLSEGTSSVRRVSRFAAYTDSTGLTLSVRLAAAPHVSRPLGWLGCAVVRVVIRCRWSAGMRYEIATTGIASRFA